MNYKLKTFLNTLYLSVFIVLNINSCQDLEFRTAPPPEFVEVPVEFYLTTPERTSLLELQTNNIFPIFDNDNFTINVIDTPDNRKQQMDGFGFSLTGGSAFHINNMSSSARDALLRELFTTEGNGIGISYIRISIGASDLDTSVFSYNDLPEGQTDTNLNSFSIAHDQQNLIPIINEILDINPDVKIMATPWSAPAWMKDNQSTIGGRLQTQYHATYANYFVKYIQAYAAEGITINAISVQNEPENEFNNPSMLMDAGQQRDFIVNHIGPRFAQEGISTDLLLFDHNCDNPNYPISILNDPVAKSFVAGSAFHLYEGNIDAMSFVKNAHPDKEVHFTEQWVEAPENFPDDFSFGVRELVIGAPRNWSETVFKWNIASDPNLEPFSPNGGCSRCLGAVTIDGNTVTRNSPYYIIGQISKFVTPGSTRLETNGSGEIQNVAFITQDNDVVLIVLNNSDVQNTLNINYAQFPITVTLPAGAAGTFIWRSES